MKALFVKEIGDYAAGTTGTVELNEIPIPVPGNEDVLIKVAYASICGSDGHTLRGNLGPFTEHVRAMLPMPIGHEVSGVVEKVGSKAAEMGFKPGDRVTGNYTRFCGVCHNCRTGKENFCTHPTNTMNGMSEYLCWHMSQVYKIPEKVSLRDAALTEPLSIAMHAVKTSKIELGSRVALFGCGSIGLMALQLARLSGASQITAFDVVPEKLQLALQLGADDVIDTSKPDFVSKALALTEGLGYDCLIESSGASQAAQSTLELLSADGNAAYFAMYKPEFEMKVNLFSEMYMKQKHLSGMYTSADIFPQTVSMLKRMNFDPIIQKIYKLDNFKQAFDDQLSGKYVKLIFEIAGE